MSAKVSRESTNNSSASQPVIAVRKVTAEGYVNLRVGGAAAKATNSRGSQKIGGKESLLSKKQAPQKYVKLDGYVMRVFAKEPVGAYTEDQMPAEQILDLRHVENLTCADKFELRPEKGTLVLKAKAEKYLFSTKRKEFTMCARARAPSSTRACAVFECRALTSALRVRHALRAVSQPT
jgi:hypothetical protein